MRKRSQKPGLKRHINYDKSFNKPLIIPNNVSQVFAYYISRTLRLNRSNYRICIFTIICCDAPLDLGCRVLLIQNSNICVIVTRPQRSLVSRNRATLKFYIVRKVSDRSGSILQLVLLLLLFSSSFLSFDIVKCSNAICVLIRYFYYLWKTVCLIQRGRFNLPQDVPAIWQTGNLHNAPCTIFFGFFTILNRIIIKIPK